MDFKNNLIANKNNKKTSAHILKLLAFNIPSEKMKIIKLVGPGTEIFSYKFYYDMLE